MKASPVRILAIAGSLRRGSHSRALVELAASLLEHAELQPYDGLATIPPFNEDDEEAAPATVLAFRAAIGAADALVIVTPEYNGSIPGQLKNALDWASRPYGLAEIVGKPVAMVSSSPSSFGGTWALADLRRVLERSGAVPLEDALSVGHVHQEGSSATVRSRLSELLTALIAASSEVLEAA